MSIFKNKIVRRFAAFLTAGVLLLSMAGCGGPAGGNAESKKIGTEGTVGQDMKQESQEIQTTLSESRMLTADVEPMVVSSKTAGSTAESGYRYAAFSMLRRLYAGQEGESLFMSPLSLAEAFEMAAWGAAGKTAEEMYGVYGFDREALTGWLYDTYIQPLTESGGPLTQANSLWLRAGDRGLSVEKDYLAAMKGTFKAQVYSAPFDETTASDINSWCSEHTDGMIDRMVGEIPPEAMMYLLNAVLFDGKWMDAYEDVDVKDGVFTCEDGTKKDVSYMFSKEETYLEDGGTTGFIKPYKDGYSFLALLPAENVSMSDFLASLDGAAYQRITDGAQYAAVRTWLPKFTGESDLDLKPVLMDMGMKEAFDPGKADFSELGSCPGGNLFISAIRQKARIQVDEKGTKAAAVTAITVTCAAAAAPEEPKEVRLDRPFVYAIVDSETLTPVFLGVQMCPEA